MTEIEKFERHLHNVLADTERFSMFGLNDGPTREAVHSLIAVFFRTYYQKLVEDFRIICDETNNTPRIIDDNMLVVDVHYKLIGANNSVHWQFAIQKNESSLEEIEQPFDFLNVEI